MKTRFLATLTVVMTLAVVAQSADPPKTTKAEMIAAAEASVAAAEASLAKARNLPDDGPIVPPPPPHDDGQHPPADTYQTVQIPGEGWKIATMAGLIPDLSASPTHTLHTGDFPVDLPADARVLIPAGVSVEVTNVVDTRVESIANKGTLKFSRTANSKLRVGTILNYPGSTYDQGAADDPIDAKSEILFDGVVDPVKDPEQILVGFISFGSANGVQKTTIHGKFSGTSTTELFAPIAAGATAITVKDATGWKAGDKLLIHDSWKVIDANRFSTSAELRAITEVRSISNNAAGTTRVVVLDQPLQYAHDGDVDHLTRNIVFRQQQGTKAHTIAMGATDFHFASTAVQLSGRSRAPDPLDDTIRNPDNSVLHTGTNQRARYAVHMHHLQLPFAIDRLVIETPLPNARWALSHHTGHGTVTNCVARDYYGAGIVGEAGTETGLHKGNSVTRHMPIGGSLNQSGPDYMRFGNKDAAGNFMEDRGYGGFGYWYRGPFVAVEDCKFNGWAIDGFQWDLEADFVAPNPVITVMRPIEGRDPSQVGSFDFEKTDITPVKRCKSTLAGLSGEGGSFVVWGCNGKVLFEGCSAKKQNTYGGVAFASFHCRQTSFSIKDCKAVVDPEVRTAYWFDQGYSMKSLEVTNLITQGFTDPVGVGHLGSIETATRDGVSLK